MEEGGESLRDVVRLPDALLLWFRKEGIRFQLSVLVLVLTKEVLVVFRIILLHVVFSFNHRLPGNLKKGIRGRENSRDIGSWCGGGWCVSKESSCLKVMGKDSGGLPKRLNGDFGGDYSTSTDSFPVEVGRYFKCLMVPSVKDGS